MVICQTKYTTKKPPSHCPPVHIYHQTSSCSNGSVWCLHHSPWKMKHMYLILFTTSPGDVLSIRVKVCSTNQIHPYWPENSLAVLVESLHVDNGVPAVRTRMAIRQSCVQVDADVAFQKNCVAIVGQIQIQWDNIPICCTWGEELKILRERWRRFIWYSWLRSALGSFA